MKTVEVVIETGEKSEIFRINTISVFLELFDRLYTDVRENIDSYLDELLKKVSPSDFLCGILLTICWEVWGSWSVL